MIKNTCQTLFDKWSLRGVTSSIISNSSTALHCGDLLDDLLYVPGGSEDYSLFCGYDGTGRSSSYRTLAKREGENPGEVNAVPADCADLTHADRTYQIVLASTYSIHLRKSPLFNLRYLRGLYSSVYCTFKINVKSRSVSPTEASEVAVFAPG